MSRALMIIGFFGDLGSTAIALMQEGSLLAGSVVLSGSLVLVSAAVQLSRALTSALHEAPAVLELHVDSRR